MTNKIDITQLLAFWGAIISTFLMGIEIIRFYYEGVRIKVEVKGGYKVFPIDTVYGDKEYVLIVVSNNGKRITTITHAWLMISSRTNLLCGECANGPRKLHEGEYTQYLIVEESLKKEYGLKQRDYIAVVSDATGKKFYSHTLPVRLFKRIRMRFLTRKPKDKPIEGANVRSKGKSRYDEFMKMPLKELKRILAIGEFQAGRVYEDRFMFSALEHAIKEKEKKWWHDPLFIGIVTSISSVIITGSISIYMFQLERQDRAKETATFQEIIKTRNTELTKSNNEKNRLKIAIKDAINSDDPSKLLSVINEINNQKE
ncbi:MAG: hypothetical protein WBE75_03335 [Candidatus Omnitrophota bacterium]